MIQAAIFDMDGLLIDSEPLWSKAFHKAFIPLGIDIKESDMQEVRGHRNNESVEHFFQKYKITGHSEAKTTQEILDDMQEFIKSEGKLLPGVHHALDTCKKAGLPIALASSSEQRIIDVVVDTLEIRHYFDHIYSAQNEKLGKPYPGVFITAAELMKVRPMYCLVFEDAPAGVLAAKAAKMKCIAVPETANRDNKFVQTADLILNTLDEFNKKILETI